MLNEDEFPLAEIVKVMTPAERSAAAKKGWITRRRKMGGASTRQLARTANIVRSTKRDPEARKSGKSLLSAKDRQQPPHVQIQRLQRIGTRAQSQADWLSGKKDSRGRQLPAELVDKVRAAEFQAKAKAAADEMLKIARASGDPRARGL